MIEFMTHPAVVILMLVVVVALIARGPYLRARASRRADEIGMEGEQYKDSTGRPRDSRKQGAEPIESVIESSERSRSDRSEQSMEEGSNRLAARGVLLDSPRPLLEAELKLDEAQQALDRVRREAVWYSHPELVGQRVRQAAHEVEFRREERNRVLIEARERSTLCAGRVRIGQQFRIGVEPRGVA